MKLTRLVTEQPTICPIETPIKEDQGYNSDVLCPNSGTECSLVAQRLLGVAIKTEVLACALDPATQQPTDFSDPLA